MKLKQLKNNLNTFPGDFDDLEVVFQSTNENNAPVYQLVCGVGYVDEPMVVVLTDERTAIKYQNKLKINNV